MSETLDMDDVEAALVTCECWPDAMNLHDPVGDADCAATEIMGERRRLYAEKLRLLEACRTAIGHLQADLEEYGPDTVGLAGTLSALELAVFRAESR